MIIIDFTFEIGTDINIEYLKKLFICAEHTVLVGVVIIIIF